MKTYSVYQYTVNEPERNIDGELTGWQIGVSYLTIPFDETDFLTDGVDHEHMYNVHKVGEVWEEVILNLANHIKRTRKTQERTFDGPTFFNQNKK